MNFSFKTFILSLFTLALTGCGGGSGDSTQTEMPINQDSTPPVITLNGAASVQVIHGNIYEEQGATANDNVEGNTQVTLSGTVNTNILGSYTIDYIATDSSGNSSKETRTISVIDLNNAARNDRIIVREKHFFVGNDGTSGRELWITDGTETGTFLVKDINPNGDSRPAQFTYIGDTLYFSADDSVHGRELWKSDGTESGTVLVSDINPSGDGLLRNSFITAMNGWIYFFGSDGVHGFELWKSNGTAVETSMVKDIAVGSATGLIHRYSVSRLGDELYFSGHSEFGARCALWKSNGTSNGTIALKHFSGASDCPLYLTKVNDVLFFSAEENNLGAELWKTDGTNSGTLMVKDIETFLLSGSTPRQLTSVNGSLVFSARTIELGTEFWVSDGTNEGTYVIDIYEGEGTSSVSQFIEFSEKVIFTARDNQSGSTFGNQCGSTKIWSSDLSVENTFSIQKDCDDESRNREIDTINPNTFFTFNGKLFFFYNRYLWESDASEFGTLKIFSGENMAQATASYNSDTVLLSFPGNQLLFRNQDDLTGLELWVTDGTESGTRIIKDVNPGSSDGYSW